MFNLSMKPKINKHLIDRIVFVLILILGLILFFYFNFSRSYQLLIIFGMITFYLVWGILHHLRDRTLDVEIFLEYLAITIIAIILIFSGI